MTEMTVSRYKAARQRRCQAYNRRLTRCQYPGHFDNYHQHVLCDVHADMHEPPMTAELARAQRQERDRILHELWRERNGHERVRA